MNKEEYEKAISIARKTILNTIDLFEESFESSKDEIVENNHKKLLRPMLEIGLLIAHTDRGRLIFLRILQFASKIDVELANEFWGHFDDLENLIEKRYFRITVEYTRQRYNTTLNAKRHHFQ